MTLNLRWFAVAAGCLASVAACQGPPAPQSGATGGKSLATLAAAAEAPCTSAACTVGEFSAPFMEPTFDGSGFAAGESPDNPLNVWPDASRCQAGGDEPPPADCRCLYDDAGDPVKCKPTAGTVALLNDGRVLYFNALEGTERVEYSIFFEAGHALQNDQTRVMTLGETVSWRKPTPDDGGADAETPEPLLPAPLNNEGTRGNDGALFCADVAHIAGGKVLAVGGTNYYNEPVAEGLPGPDGPFPFGISELEGLKNARLFDPASNSWTQTGPMKYGRWYPTVVSLARGDILVASGVTKLLKPVYPDRPVQSGSNVQQTETWGLCSGAWMDNGALAERSLPLFPRLHLLPNGHVFYNGGGQAFNPFGQSYDQATWNIVAAYRPDDPGTDANEGMWTDLGIAGLPLAAAADPARAAALAPGAGFRGSTFSAMLPLAWEETQPGVFEYRKAEFLTAGGVTGNLVLTSPGSNQPTAHSRIDSVSVNGDGGLTYDSRATGDMNKARWYGTAVVLPNGTVMVFSGADRDEVQVPGTGMPIRETELFDPATGEWTVMATQGRPRTYHNTAMLLPDGSVLVGGHAPINTAYGYSVTLPGFSPNDGRDPSFEIYRPPYMTRVRPAITSSDRKTLRPGESFTLTTHEANTVDRVVLVRRTDLTHLVDADQRTVMLRFNVKNPGKELRVFMPAQAAVAPPGEYMLFIVDDGVPSVSIPVSVPGPAC